MSSSSESRSMTIDPVIRPLIDIVKHYPARNFERRALMLIWIVNLVKPVSAIEIAKIMDYNYRKTLDLFLKLRDSGLVIEVKGEPRSLCYVGSENLRIYVENGVVSGNTPMGRTPNLYVLKELSRIDRTLFLTQFSKTPTDMIEYAWKKIQDYVEEITPRYKETLLDDLKFVGSKLGDVLQVLMDDKILVLDKQENHTDAVLRPRTGRAYRIPIVGHIKRVF